jgi:hypothetical protein
MSSNKKGMVVLGVALVVGATYYYFTMTKMAYAKIIAKNTGVDFRKYMDFDKDYLKARAEAFKKEDESFMVGGIYYSTETGKVKK